MYQPGKTVWNSAAPLAFGHLHPAAERLALGALDAGVGALGVAVPDVHGGALDRLAGAGVHDVHAKVEGESGQAFGDVAPNEIEVEVVGALGQLGHEDAVGRRRGGRLGRGLRGRGRGGRVRARRAAVRCAGGDDGGEPEAAGQLEGAAPRQGGLEIGHGGSLPGQSKSRLSRSLRIA